MGKLGGIGAVGALGYIRSSVHQVALRPTLTNATGNTGAILPRLTEPASHTTPCAPGLAYHALRSGVNIPDHTTYSVVTDTG